MDDVVRSSLEPAELTSDLHALVAPSLAPIFWRAERLGATSAWWQHVPFAHWLVCTTKPRLLVELGTHAGVSYSAFCQAAARCGLDTRCYAVDTWRGDSQAGLYGEEVFEEFRHYHDERYSAFSTLLRSTFDDALAQFTDGTVDLLHIDGLHTYEAVRHDFESWKPKLSSRAVVLFHDTNERKDDFGVWRLWAELCERFPHFEFLHGHGLGVLAVGKDIDPTLLSLCRLLEPTSVAAIRNRFEAAGERCAGQAREQTLALKLGLPSIGEHAEILHQSVAASAARAEQARAAAAASEQAGREAEARAEKAEANAEQAEADARRAEQRREDAEAKAEQAEADAGRAEQRREEAEANAAAWQARAAENEAARERIARRMDAARRDVHDASVQKELAEAETSRVAELARRAEIERDEAVRARDAVLFSTAWRITWPVRAVGERLPPGMQQGLRRAAKLVWWSLTLKLPRKLRERREAAKRRPPPPAAAQPVSEANLTAPRRRRFFLRRAGTPDLSLTPMRDLYDLGGGAYVTTGRDPQFLLNQGRHPPRPGWALVTVDVADARQLLRPVLYVSSGGPVAQVAAFRLPVVTHGRVRTLVVLPADVRSLRLDPIDAAGARFSIANASVRHISKPRLFCQALLNLDPVARKAMFAAVWRRDLATVRLLVQSALTSADEAQYDAWVKLYDTLSPTDHAAISEQVQNMRWRPIISVIMPVYNPRPEYLRQALDSVIHQLYPDWELCIADDASTDRRITRILEEYAQADARIKIAYRRQNGHVCAASNTATDLAKGEYLAFMDHDDLIPAHALYMVADELNRHPDADLIYTDEDKVDHTNRRHDPLFKTDWNRELFHSQNMIAHMGVYRASLVREIGGFRIGFEGSQDYDLALRFIRRTDPSRIRHIPHVLYHWRIFAGVSSLSSDNPQESIETARRALEDHFAAVEPGSEVVPCEAFPSWWRIKRRLPEPLPRVSLIVPTRDRVDLLEVAIDGLLRGTDYPDLEVIIIDNESVESGTLDYLDMIRTDPRVKVARIEGPFDFSRLNNQAVRMATGCILGFVNSDVKVMQADWLKELVTQISQPNVGAVGAKLYYANETVQHAGVILGLYGVAAHGHRHFPRGSVGYFGRTVLVQNISAVTAACMLVPRQVFDEVGGYTERHLAVGYNDVDFCLRIRDAGYDIVFTPFAELYHLESQTRGENVSAQQRERENSARLYMLERWGDVIRRDPFYNPNLTAEAEDFGLSFPPRVAKPWSLTEQAVTSEKPSDRSISGVAAESAASPGFQASLPAGCCAQLISLRQRFDSMFPVDPTVLLHVARASSLIVIDVAPFTNVAALVNELAQERIAFGQLVVVDGTAELIPGTAIRDHMEEWRLRLASTKVTIAAYLRQELRFSDAVQRGLGVAENPFLWILGLDCIPTDGSLEYLLKAFIIEGQESVIVGQTFAMDGTLRPLEVPRAVLGGAELEALTIATEFTLAPQTSREPADPSALSPISEVTSFGCGIFGGIREALLDAHGADQFDRLFVTDAAIADVSLNLRARGIRLVRSSGSACISLRPGSLGAAAPWEAVHDWRWLMQKRRPWNGIDPERIELVCPFYRGDLLLAVQVAGHARSLGMRIRLHTAMSLVPWVRDMSGDIDVERIPMPVPPAGDGYAQVLSAYLYVSQRSDVSPRLARCHPSRNLSDTGKNLLAYMLEEVGLPPGSLLTNMKPSSSSGQRHTAQQVMQPFGQDVVFLHPLGGWALKSIPGHLLPDLAEYVHDAGLKLIQIGGPADPRVNGCDGAILQDFLPSQWREILSMGRALIGVDSWSAHFASILDMPQVTLYGSTHPRHVHTKAWFSEQASPALALGPSVSCSPCNSFTCATFVGKTYCTGYSIDGEALGAFLASVRNAPLWVHRRSCAAA